VREISSSAPLFFFGILEEIELIVKDFFCKTEKILKFHYLKLDPDSPNLSIPLFERQKNNVTPVETESSNAAEQKYGINFCI
jgi:hypothetical protein